MTQFRHYQIKFLNKSKEVPTKEEFIDAMKQTEFLKFTRGHFLDLVIEVELIISVIIENYLLHNNSRLKNVFRKNITNNRNITFMQKIEILHEIINEVQELSDEDSRLLKEYLNFIRAERNKWAHGVIHFEQEEKGGKLILQSYLNSINSNGGESEIKLTNSYFDDLTKKFETNQKFLIKILVKRKFLPKDYPIKK